LSGGSGGRKPRGFCLALLGFASICTASAQHSAPPSPEKPWQPPGYKGYQAELERAGKRVDGEQKQSILDPEKVYDLADLIDIAERVHPETRAAWERARQAASAVGLAQSAYYPWLVASAAAGYERAFIPFPELQVGPGPTDVSIKGGGTLATDAAAE